LAIADRLCDCVQAAVGVFAGAPFGRPRATVEKVRKIQIDDLGGPVLDDLDRLIFGDHTAWHFHAAFAYDFVHESDYDRASVHRTQAAGVRAKFFFGVIRNIVSRRKHFRVVLFF
jgi:hypothetical protein